MIAVDAAKDEVNTENYSNHVPNAVTLAAMQEAEDIISGKIQIEWNSFPPVITKTEAKEELKKILGI